MSQYDSNDIRNLAEQLLSNTQSRPMSLQGSISSHMGPADLIRARNHHINLITEEYLAGYMQDGRMSVVRRFFCLFVTFDLFFVSLLWLICIVINGDNIYIGIQKQIIHYSVYTSLFDVVAAAICRFTILIFFYALLYINHWFIIAFSTTGSCVFLISKVFVFDWLSSKEQVFEVILILTSFVLAWGEAWFLDCRVIPQERHARSLFPSNYAAADRSPIMATFLASQSNVIINNVSESVSNFYSPLDTVHNSDDEEDQDEDYHQMALNCVRKAYELFESTDWKVEKVTNKGDTIQSAQRDKIGKVFKLTARIKYPPKALMKELFYNVEAIPKWNPTILESKILRNINSYTDLTYQASASGGGGFIKSRDFVNLRCWRLFRNGKMISSEEDEELEGSDDTTSSYSRSCEGSVTTLSDVDSNTPLPGSVTSNRSKFGSTQQEEHQTVSAYETLSKSLGAQAFGDNITSVNYDLLKFNDPPPLEDNFEDATDQEHQEQLKLPTATGTTINKAKMEDRVWLSAAVSVDYVKMPTTAKYIRGENIVAAFAFREIAGKRDACIFEWVLCLDLKGFVPRYVLDAAYTSFMTDYMTYLRKYVEEMRQRRKRTVYNKIE